MLDLREWLLNYRKKAGLSQENIAKHSEISQQMYAAVETGARNPSVETAKKIAEVLDFGWTRFFEDINKNTA